MVLKIFKDAERTKNSPEEDISCIGKIINKCTSKDTIHSVFHIRTADELNVLKQACISGKIDLKDYGVDPSPVSNPLNGIEMS